MVECFDARQLMMIGAQIMSVGLGVISAATSIHVYLAAWILFGIGGTVSLSTAAQIALAEIFGDRARQAISAMSLVSGLSNTIMWPMMSQWLAGDDRGRCGGAGTDLHSRSLNRCDR